MINSTKSITSTNIVLMNNGPTISSLDTTDWETRWSNMDIPWDTKIPAPSIQDYIIPHLPDSGVALIPGCGSGYDVIKFDSLPGWSALGLDISESAIQHAHSLYPDKKSLFQVGDFFTFESPQFDCIFDYTFFTALSPLAIPSGSENSTEVETLADSNSPRKTINLRKNWGDAMKRLLKPCSLSKSEILEKRELSLISKVCSKEPQLFTLAFPVLTDISLLEADLPHEDGDGPPFPMTPALLEQYLGPLGFINVETIKIPETHSHPKRAGREYLCRWVLPSDFESIES